MFLTSTALTFFHRCISIIRVFLKDVHGGNVYSFLAIFVSLGVEIY